MVSTVHLLIIGSWSQGRSNLAGSGTISFFRSILLHWVSYVKLGSLPDSTSQT